MKVRSVILSVFLVANHALVADDASPENEDAPPIEETHVGDASTEAAQNTNQATLNAAGYTFIALAVGGIIFSALRSGGNAH